MHKVLSATEVAPIHLLANTDLRLILNILCEGGKVEKGTAPHCSQYRGVSTQPFLVRMVFHKDYWAN